MNVSARERATDLEPEPAGAAPSLNHAAGLRDDVFHDRQAKAGAVRRSRAISAEEPFEQTRQLRLGNAAAVVRNREEDAAALRARRDRAACAVTRVADRVRHEVLHEDAQDPRPHGDHDVLGDDRHERLCVPLGARPQRLDDFADDRRDGHVTESDHSATRLELTEKENVVDQLCHRFDLLPSLLEQRSRVRARQGSAVEEGEQPRKGRPELV